MIFGWGTPGIPWVSPLVLWFKRDISPEKKTKVQKPFRHLEKSPSTLSEWLGCGWVALGLIPGGIFQPFRPFPHSGPLPQQLSGLSAFCANFFKCSFSASVVETLLLGLELSKGDQVTR